MPGQATAIGKQLDIISQRITGRSSEQPALLEHPNLNFTLYLLLYFCVLSIFPGRPLCFYLLPLRRMVRKRARGRNCGQFIQKVTRRGGAARREHFGTISRPAVQSVEGMPRKVHNSLQAYKNRFLNITGTLFIIMFRLL